MSILRDSLTKSGAASRHAKAPARRKRNRAGRPTADELERRKLRVMEVATDMFVSRGYAATTLLAIAKKSGVATRTLYQHFGDKEGIFREVIFARDTAIINPPCMEEGENLIAVLRKAAQYSYEIALRPRSIELMRLMIAESARYPDLISSVATKIFSRFTGNVARLFYQLAETGLIPSGDHAQSAELFVDLLLGNRTVMIYFGWLNSAPTEHDIEVKLDLFINGRFGAVAAGKRTRSSKTQSVGVAKAAAIENEKSRPRTASGAKNAPEVMVKDVSPVAPGRSQNKLAMGAKRKA